MSVSAPGCARLVCKCLTAGFCPKYTIASLAVLKLLGAQASRSYVKNRMPEYAAEMLVQRLAHTSSQGNR